MRCKDTGYQEKKQRNAEIAISKRESELGRKRQNGEDITNGGDGNGNERGRGREDREFKEEPKTETDDDKQPVGGDEKNGDNVETVKADRDQEDGDRSQLTRDEDERMELGGC